MARIGKTDRPACIVQTIFASPRVSAGIRKWRSAETGIAAGEEFEKHKIGRLDRLRAEINVKGMAALPEQELERIAQFKTVVIGRISELTGLSFDQDGRCTNPEKFRMNGEFKEKWAQVCQEFGTEDPQKAERLLKEAGSLLRGAIETPVAGELIRWQ